MNEFIINTEGQKDLAAELAKSPGFLMGNPVQSSIEVDMWRET